MWSVPDQMIIWLFTCLVEKSDENRELALMATKGENCQKDEMWTKCQTCWETSEFEVGSLW